MKKLLSSMKVLFCAIGAVCAIASIAIFLTGCSAKEAAPNTFLYDLQERGMSVKGPYIVKKAGMSEADKKTLIKNIVGFLGYVFGGIGVSSQTYEADDLMVIQYMGEAFRETLKSGMGDDFESYVEGVKFGEGAYVKLPRGATAVMPWAFSGESAVKYVDLSGSVYLSVQDGAFDEMPSLERFVGDAKAFGQNAKGAHPVVADVLNDKYNLDLDWDKADNNKHPKLARAIFKAKHKVIAIVLTVLMWIGGFAIIGAFAFLDGFLRKALGIAVCLLPFAVYFLLPIILY
jgi:hypothetical protein